MHNLPLIFSSTWLNVVGFILTLVHFFPLLRTSGEQHLVRDSFKVSAEQERLFSVFLHTAHPELCKVFGRLGQCSVCLHHLSLMRDLGMPFQAQFSLGPVSTETGLSPPDSLRLPGEPLHAGGLSSDSWEAASFLCSYQLVLPCALEKSRAQSPGLPSSPSRPSHSVLSERLVLTLALGCLGFFGCFIES